MINSVTSFLIIGLIFIFAYFGFGLYILSKLRLKFSIVEQGVIATILSVSIISSLIVVVGQFIGTLSYYLLLLPFILGIIQYKEILKYVRSLFNVIKKNKLGSLFLVACILILSSTVAISLLKADGSFSLQEVHDSVWHIALVENLLESIPPLHPSDPTVLLTNYHYFYDVFLTTFAKFSSISLFSLYYQYSVFFLGSILVSTAYMLGNKLNGKLAGYYLVGFTTFVGSFAYLIPYFNPGQTWHESSFWVSQTLVMMVNPQVIYTLAVSYTFIFLLQNLLNTKFKKPEYIKLNALVIILAATSIGFKSYAWVILTAIYGLFLLVELIKNRSLKTIGIGFIYLAVSIPMVWLITRFKGNSFFYEPLWFTNSMIESADRVNYLEWKFLQDHYLFKKNWPRLFILETNKLAVFYFGNLGIRGLFIFLPLLYFIKRKKYFVTISLYIFFGFLFSSIFPLLFLQRGTVWNSIQFWYYALIFANILAVILISEILKNKSKFVIGTVTAILLVFALPTSIKTVEDKNRKPFVFGHEEVSFLGNLTFEDKIMICPENSSVYHSSLIKVTTPAEIYLANPGQLDLVGSDKQKSSDYLETISKGSTTDIKKLFDETETNILLCTDRHLTGIFSNTLGVEAETIGKLKVFKLN